MNCYHLVYGMQMGENRLFGSTIFLIYKYFFIHTCMYAYKTIMNITTNLLHIGYLGPCASHKCILGQCCTIEGTISVLLL